MGAAHVHVYWGLLRAAAEEARPREDGDDGQPLLPDAKPALHRRVAVPDPQRPVAGGRRGEMPGVDVGPGVGRAQGCVSLVRQRMIQLCLLCDRAERLHCGGPQVEVAVTTGDLELGVAGTRRRILQDDVLGRRPICLEQQRVAVVGGGPGKAKWVLSVSSAHAQSVPKSSQGHLVDRLRRARGDPRGPSRSACRRRWRMTSASTVWTHGLWMPHCRGSEAATPSPSGTVPEMATAHVRLRWAASTTLVACLQGPPPDTSEDVWPQASGIQ